MSDELTRLSKHQPLIKNLYEACKEKLGFEPDVKIVILNDGLNSEDPLGKTAYYDPASYKVGLYTQGRHIKDIMRSLSHELVHHSQNCRGDFDSGIATVEGYAQEDGHLREMEREAYETGNLLFRDWEDNYKRNDNRKLFSITTTEGERMRENKINIREMVDQTLVDEIVLTMKNNEDFYFQTIKPWIQNLQRKMADGVFDERLALKAFEDYVAKDAIKKYAKEQAGDPSFARQIEKEDRLAIGKELLDNYMEEIEDVMTESKDAKLREVIRGMVKEMLISVEENIDDEKDDAEEEEAEAAEVEAEESEGQTGAVYKGVTEEVEKDEPYEVQAEANDPGGGDKADVKEKDEGVEDEEEELDESFFPVGHDIRGKARIQINEALMKKWGYNKKEK